MLTGTAPAKINLTLEVLGKRDDGFHEIRSVIQTTNLCDSFTFQPGRDIVVKSTMPGWTAEESLVSKTINLLRQVTGCFKGAVIEIEKRIPLMSGLGGDSSGAAAVLRGLNRLWELELSLEELTGLAVQLGSDVAFFLHGGTALLEGRGEIVIPLPSLIHRWIVLLVPRLPRLTGKTGRLYASLEKTHHTDGSFTRRLVEIIRAGQQIQPSLLFNVFENVVFAHFSGLSQFRERMMLAGAANIHLAGSGPTLFSLFADKAPAEKLHLALERGGLESYLLETLPAIGEAD